MGGQAVAEPKDGLLQFEILLDRSSIEIFVNDGEVVLSSCFTPAEEDDDLTLWTQGGELFVNEIQVYELKSAWNGKWWQHELTTTRRHDTSATLSASRHDNQKKVRQEKNY